MKKKKLVVDYEIDFDLFGLISTVKDYKLAWLLNKHLSIHLTREEDLSITFASGFFADSNVDKDIFRDIATHSRFIDDSDPLNTFFIF